MWNRSERHEIGRRDLLTGGTAATALAAIAAVNLPIAYLGQLQHLVSGDTDLVHHAQVAHPDDYLDFWASG